jgi:hypothetical protein
MRLATVRERHTVAAAAAAEQDDGAPTVGPLTIAPRDADCVCVLD